MTKDTIALVSTYSHPSRDSVEATLRKAFPEYQVENIALSDLIRDRKTWILPNLLSIAMEYGRDVLTSPSSMRELYFQTTYVFRQIRWAMRNVIDPDRHVFSFQTQSMFDTSVPGVPHFIYTDHTHLSNLSSSYFNLRKLRPKAWVALEREIYENAACVFTRSSNITADLQRYYGISSEKIVCAYAGSNVDVAEDVQTENDGYANRNILFVGGDWERKGGLDLTEAFRRVLKSCPDARLTIAGATPELDLPNCEILGHVPLSKLGDHYACASIFCLPTRLEPFGIAFIEAMLHRLPIVGTRVGAVPDMIKDGVTGYLVPPADPAQLAEALIKLLRDPALCRTYGEAGYRHALEWYTWEKVGQRMRERIMEVLTEHAEGPRHALNKRSCR